MYMYEKFFGEKIIKYDFEEKLKIVDLFCFIFLKYNRIELNFIM